jgi:hypothetical protein
MNIKTATRLLREFAAASQNYRDAVFLVNKLKFENVKTTDAQIELSLATEKLEGARDMVVRLEAIVQAYTDKPKEAA